MKRCGERQDGKDNSYLECCSLECTTEKFRRDSLG